MPEDDGHQCWVLVLAITDPQNGSENSRCVPYHRNLLPDMGNCSPAHLGYLCSAEMRAVSITMAIGGNLCFFIIRVSTVTKNQHWSISPWCGPSAMLVLSRSFCSPGSWCFSAKQSFACLWAATSFPTSKDDNWIYKALDSLDNHSRSPVGGSLGGNPSIHVEKQTLKLRF
jgi:hypothetical protein